MKKTLGISIALFAPFVIFAKNIDIAVSKGITQSTINMLVPTPSQMDTESNITALADFAVTLDPSHVKKNDIRLMNLDQNKQIPGAVSLVDGHIASFKPHSLLAPGHYEITYQSLKPTKEEKEIQIKEIKYRFYVPEVINGYRLPPEPDEAINNSTLLGIDVNGNGVRDDTEIYIIKRYASDPNYPKTKTAIALQYAWASQKVLEAPSIESKKYIDDALDCESYWAWKETQKYTEGQSNFEKGLYYSNLSSLIDSALKDNIYNTRARIERKISFNAALSGNIFDGREESMENCQVDIDALGE